MVRPSDTHATSLRIRACVAEDFEALYRLDQACYPPGIAYSRRALRWFLALPGADCLVAEANSEIAGFILTEAESGSGHIITIDVAEAHRRRGLGTALLREAELRLAAHGAYRVELETAVDNAPAVAFWREHGYRTRGTLKRYYLGRTDAFLMEKSLLAHTES